MQVIALSSEDDQVEITTLDGIWNALPTLDQTRACTALKKNYGAWKGAVGRQLVPPRVPWRATFVGNMEPVVRFKTPCLSWAGWHGFEAFLQWRDDQLTPSERSAGAGRTEICITGSDPNFIADVRSRRALSALEWSGHDQREIDLRGTLLQSLTLETGDLPVLVRLPTYLTDLTLSGKIANVRVEATHVTSPFTLTLKGPELPSVVPGLEAIESLRALELRHVDAACVALYPALRSVVLGGAPGSITNVEAFAELRHLENLELVELYDLDGDAFPDASRMPALKTVTVNGIRKEAAATMKKKLKLVDATFRNVRSAEWILANLENPFRSWSEENSGLGKVAAAAWKKAATEMGVESKLADGEKILHDLVDALNRANAKYDLDTTHREDAFDAFMTLSARCAGLEPAAASAWFDAWRDF